METKKIVMGVISIAVAIIVLMSMIPIFTDAGASEDTLTNDGYFRMSKITDESEGTLTIVWDHSTPGGLTINGDYVPLSADVTVSVLPDTNFTVRMSNIGTTTEQIQWYNVVGGAYTASIVGGSDMEIVCESGTATATITTDGVESTPRTANYTVLYYPDLNGAYTMKKASESAYLNGDSEIFGCGTSNIKGYDGNNVGGSQAFGAVIGGNLDDGITVTEWRNTASGLAVMDSDSMTVSYTEVGGHEDLYSLSDIRFVVTVTQTVDEETYTTDNNITYSYFVVPYEVTAERSAHTSPVESTLIGLIPLLMMVGIMLTAVGLFIAKYRKN